MVPNKKLQSDGDLGARHRREILDALRRGTVPKQCLEVFAVGLDRFRPALLEELSAVASGGSAFKAVRGEYGAGKTFFARWFQQLAKSCGFAASEVQISETETPLHKLETVYRRVIEGLSTAADSAGPWGAVVDRWLLTLRQEAVNACRDDSNEIELLSSVEELFEQRLAVIGRQAPAFALALRAYRRFSTKNDRSNATAVLAWLGGQPNIAASLKRAAGLKGDLDHYGALSFLHALSLLLRDCGYAGLVIVLDEVETLQRVPRDLRDKWLNALRQLIDEVDSGRFSGLYLLVTGTTALFEGTQGIQRLAPLAQRLHVEFGEQARFDNLRAVQLRLDAFTQDALIEVGAKVRDLFADGSPQRGRVLRVVDDEYIRKLTQRLVSRFGGRVGIVPRIFLKMLVADVLDRVEQFADFDPWTDCTEIITVAELNESECAAAGVTDVNQIALEL